MELFINSLAEDFFQDSGVSEPSFNKQMEINSHSDTGAQELTSAPGGNIQQYSSLEGFSFNSLNSPRIDSLIDLPERSRTMRKSISWTNSSARDVNTVLNASSSTILQFQNQSNTSSANIVQADVSAKSEKEIATPSHVTEWTKEAVNRKVSKTTLSQYHVIAERKRREKLCRGFIELSAIIPGLKKMDKATVLGDTIKYVKQLQEKLKCLEDQKAETTFFIKKSRIISASDCISSSDDNFDGGVSNKYVPELEVKISGRSVCVKIHCEKHKGVVAKVLAEIEELNLSITSATAIPFTEYSLDIIITAQIEGALQMTAVEIAQKLSSAFDQFM